MRLLFAFIFGLSGTLCFAQYNFVEFAETPVSEPGREMRFPWAGGLNGVHYGTMQLNDDQLPDLVAFDRSSGRIYCFLRQGDFYTHAPSYEAFFPGEIFNFFQLKDFDQDGRSDLFTAGNLGIMAYRNVGTTGIPRWEKISDFLTYRSPSGNEVNLQLNFNDYPYIGDMDGDGDIDVLNFTFSGLESKILFYKNFSVERTGTADLNALELVNSHWGQVEDCDCGIFALGNENCQDLLNAFLRSTRHAGGKSVALFTLNGGAGLDLISSHEECSALYYFQNNSQSTENPALSTFTTDFPNSANPAAFNFYPNLMPLDISGDAQEELLISPNLSYTLGSIINFEESSWLYTLQNGTYRLQTKSFLQEQMIDWGVQAVPTTFDFDEDGDPDLFIAYTSVDENSNIFSAVAYYENKGSTEAPSFHLITPNFLDIASLNLENLVIQWQDLDQDGKTDLLLQGAVSSTNQLYVIYQESSGYAAGSAALLNDIFIGFGFSAYFTDVNQDGNIDLLIGKSSGGLMYYENTGAGRAPNFELVNNSYLGIGDDFFRSSLKVITGDLNNDGEEDLLTSDRSGIIRVYNDFRTENSPIDSILTFNPIQNQFNTGWFGERNYLTLAHLYDEKYPALLVGSISGGLRIFRNTKEYSLQNSNTLNFEVYPNPNTSRLLAIRNNQPLTLHFSNLTGQVVRAPLTVAAFSSLQVNLQHLPKGIYVVSAETIDGKRVSRRIILE